jgi:hypothetical protein
VAINECTQSGALCQISNSRRAIYGYDQRIEALGSKGALRAENMVESTVSFAGADGIISDKPLHFFLERYAEAYRRELDHFIGTTRVTLVQAMSRANKIRFHMPDGLAQRTRDAAWARAGDRAPDALRWLYAFDAGAVAN